jgi:hypothetical protein
MPIGTETFEAFAARIRSAAPTIPIVRGAQRTTLDKLSERDRNANIDRWWLEGRDPTVEAAVEAVTERQAEPTKSEKRATVNEYPIAPGEDPEVFYGWVLRACDPGLGWEWATVTLPRHIVEGLAIADKSGRKIRMDAREVMTHEIGGELMSWNLGDKTRKGPRCKHTLKTRAGVEGSAFIKDSAGNRTCVQCGTAESTDGA